MTAALTVRDLQDRVARGVVWLDANLPDWWKTDRPDRGDNGGPIRVDELSMSHNCYCVLGQLLGNYYRAEISIEQAVEFGFDSSVGSLARDVSEVDEAMADEFDALRELWIRVLEERRAGVSTP
ncbi:hypothetical protein [Micromonospora robiginosa]|uniref:Uncharacterized protein n=1 Tax=Micromonospora robiginosa TaxID=2749844 RepID=A0A7L6B7N9_9ACTN|nr:hypothetical protein [Micromonospora ferruginea]QLQ37967.1 hypothetical protein H1D33_03475 [Micromonospora ferruginea]